MKAISVKQPWAALIAVGWKWIETRTWSTDYRGPLLIVASKQPDRVAMQSLYDQPDTLEMIEPLLVYGKALCRCTLVNCRAMLQEDEQLARCVCYPGAYAWVLNRIERIEPFLVRGQLGLYDVEVPA